MQKANGAPLFFMTWINMAIKPGMGRRFAFARLQR
jgi:hypothetical protein